MGDSVHVDQDPSNVVSKKLKHKPSRVNYK